MRFPLYIWPQCVQRNQKLRAENMMIVSFKSIFLKQMILFHATTKSWRGSNSELGSIQGFHNVLRVRSEPGSEGGVTRRHHGAATHVTCTGGWPVTPLPPRPSPLDRGQHGAGGVREPGSGSATLGAWEPFPTFRVAGR